MPIYEYLCKECGLFFEEICKVGEDKKSCPKCNTLAEKQISQIANPVVQQNPNDFRTDITTSEKELDRRVGIVTENRNKEIEKERSEIKKAQKELNTDHVYKTQQGYQKVPDEEIKFRKEIQQIMTKGKSENPDVNVVVRKEKK